MQLLRAARAACTNLNLRVISIGSSLSLGPIFFYRYNYLARRSVLSQKKDCLAANLTLTRLALINRNRMNVTSFERNYWSAQVKMFICNCGCNCDCDCGYIHNCYCSVGPPD